eukprot:EG_transcript_40568
MQTLRKIFFEKLISYLEYIFSLKLSNIEKSHGINAAIKERSHDNLFFICCLFYLRSTVRISGNPMASWWRSASSQAPWNPIAASTAGGTSFFQPKCVPTGTGSAQSPPLRDGGGLMAAPGRTGRCPAVL